MEEVCPQKGMKKLSFIEMTCPLYLSYCPQKNTSAIWQVGQQICEDKVTKYATAVCNSDTTWLMSNSLEWS